MSLTHYEQSLLDLLSSNTEVSVTTIAKRLFVSKPTARRYLAALAEKGLVIRTHGGAILNNMSENKNVPLYLRLSKMKADKVTIATKAVKLIQDGNVIFLDSSSTAFHMLPYLENFRNLLILTNSLKTAITLTEMGIQTVLTGGKVDSSNFACNSHETLEAIKKVNADYFFFSCDALSDDGKLTDNSQTESFVRQEFMKYAKTNVLLIDSSKLHKKCWYNLCSLDNVDECFCNVDLPDKLTSMLKKDTPPVKQIGKPFI